MPRRRDDVPILKATVQSLVALRDSLPPGYDTVKSGLAAAEERARRELGVLLADLEMER